ncbi:MAG: hypothetical protein IPJ88_15320 [Myxococcales bacterium]|nr:MAG: hypothetical protein IPJ88_15320 [Myxococcales bacterium]
MQYAEAMQRFLQSVAPPGEAEFYLKLFHEQKSDCFAVISVQRGVAEDALEAVALDLKVLSLLGLFPLVVVGLDSKQASSARRAQKLESLLLQSEVAAEFCKTDLEAAKRALKNESIPLLVIDESEDPKERIAVFIKELRAKKLVFLHRRGAIVQGQERVPALRLDQLDSFVQALPTLGSEQRSMLELSKAWIEQSEGRRFLVAITSPLELLRELFSIKGAGTLLRWGSSITRHTNFSALDSAALNQIIEASFARRLDDAFWEKQKGVLYLEENFRGLALMRCTPLGDYLDKFAVTKDARGEGVGGDLWQAVVAQHKGFFWRARPDNPILPWYQKHCDGMQRSNNWWVFWRGLPAVHTAELVAFADFKPSDFR